MKTGLCGPGPESRRLSAQRSGKVIGLGIITKNYLDDVLALPRSIWNWSLTSSQQRLVKTGGRLVRHARYHWLLLAEGHLSRRLFGGMLRMIAALPLPDG